MPGPLREDSPRRIGPYAIRARLGAGGMGEVYLGVRDEETGAAARGTDAPGGAEPVAVKTVRRDVAGDPGFRTRFRREITLARSVTGPHLAPLLDGDADAEVPWLATGYVAGPTLSAAVRRSGALGEEEVRMLGAGLARALAAVHTAGVVHRDVKPGNVMLASDGPRLIDFGIARDTGATALTTTSRMVGSPAFMSPEHVAGGGRVTFASDIFCLASVLCYAATGRDPFGDGPLAAVLYRIKYVEADLDGVPSALRGVLADCLVAGPEGRPTAAGLAARLAPDAAVGWPGPVAEHIAEHERELAALRALDGPLLPPYTPTQAATGSRTPADQLPTQGPGLPRDPGPGPDREQPPGPAASRPPLPSWGRYVRAAVIALVLAGAATGGLLALRDGEQGGSGGPEGSGGGPAQVLAGIDAQGGPDGSGTVPYGREVRPTGWKPWQGKLSAAPLGCAAGRYAVVCRRTDGSYEALSAADGRKLWDYAAEEEGNAPGARVSPTGQFFMPGGSTRPAIHGDTVFLATGNRLLALDSRTGKTRWESRTGGAYWLDSTPLVADGLVFADIGDTPYGARVAAFDVRTGEEKWRKPLVGDDISKAEWNDYWPLATEDGVLYILGQHGVRALRTKDGEELGRATDENASRCQDALVRPPLVYCSVYTDTSDEKGLAVYRLRAPSLKLTGEVPVPPGPAVATGLTFATGLVAVDDDVMVLRRGSAPWEGDDGNAAEIVVAPRDGGTPLGRYPLDQDAGDGRRNPVSAPVIVADTVVWADSTTLYSVPLNGASTPGKLRRTPLKGAPGPSVPPEYDELEWGAQFDQELLPPEILPVGGAVYVLYDQGTVLSVPLPGPAAS
ncbi:serine/threonine-protein kinase [Streptomyces sp. BE147]|uniref:serine/threonine-protein kinase n=1 Tax=Streptomyces sp. BE147 TaxID=3002524 RepID=UPI002E787718|nr:serine/threonine-protein kinase [Streptomyces sp. BE147]MEE1741398.1 serine/threonine-protein kinase [Streptomyces sp. BE147]